VRKTAVCRDFHPVASHGFRAVIHRTVTCLRATGRAVLTDVDLARRKW
jgi:hypothetical protein